MAKAHDDYKKLDTPTGLEPCPCCGAVVEMWQYSTSETAPTQKVVMCSNSDAFGPQEGEAFGGCPLYMPSNGHYQPTIREAAKYWNEFARALQGQQRSRRWNAHQATREAAP